MFLISVWNCEQSEDILHESAGQIAGVYNNNYATMQYVSRSALFSRQILFTLDHIKIWLVCTIFFVTFESDSRLVVLIYYILVTSIKPHFSVSQFQASSRVERGYACSSLESATFIRGQLIFEQSVFFSANFSQKNVIPCKIQRSFYLIFIVVVMHPRNLILVHGYYSAVYFAKSQTVARCSSFVA